MNLKTNPELLPLIEWWEKDGKQTVIYLVVAALLVGGWYGFKNYRAARKVAASEALASAYTTEELEEAVSKYSGSDTAGALKIRLAKSYYDAGRNEEALATYDELVGKAPEGFADIPVVGRAQALEALGRFADAQKAFDDFAAANPSNYLALTAKLGAVRCLAAADKKSEALKRLESLKKDFKDDTPEKALVENTEALVKRYVKPSAKPAAPAAKPEARPAAPVAKPAAKAAPAAPKAAAPAAKAPAAKPAEKAPAAKSAK